MSSPKTKSAKKTVAAAPKATMPAYARSKAHARFDARLSQEQKDLFEQAARIKGFKSLTEFVIYYRSEAATIIIEKHNQILSSEKDKIIFFDALINPPKPNAALLKASKRYKEQVAGK